MHIGAIQQHCPPPPPAYGSIGAVKEACRMWAVHTCKFGDHCRFSHAGPGGPAKGKGKCKGNGNDNGKPNGRSTADGSKD